MLTPLKGVVPTRGTTPLNLVQAATGTDVKRAATSR